ncbi:CRAL-TRIO domain-containing protein, partial [Penicillium odoratum]|uniref:CRAL-TRIO domain-containing protein n=1 Tax=Penicillium odoratum TaxID=1167516 RepID=UPI0025481261
FKSQCDKTVVESTRNNASLDVSDATILRFLRSVNFDVDRALSRFCIAEQRRNKHGLELFYQNVDISLYEMSRKMVSSKFSLPNLFVSCY